MLIGNNYKIDTDPHNIILKRKAVSKKAGTENWTTEGYFYTLQYCLEWMVENEIRADGLGDVKKIIKKLDEIHETIRSLKDITVADLKQK